MNPFNPEVKAPMKRNLLIMSLSALLICYSCTSQKPMEDIINESLSFAVKQYGLMTDVIREIPDELPRTLDDQGNLITVRSGWWTSGFFPGSLWYLYEFTADQQLKDDAILISSRVEREKYTTNNHDVGFILYCSYGNGLRLTGEESYTEVLLTGARSLSKRFRPNIGTIQSWAATPAWQCPVIVDNMMNLELLMWAFKKSGDSSFYKIAVKHSDTTMKNHYRPDHSAYHVVSYDTITGQVEAKQTHQGFSDESDWARGQSWGLYGFVMMYRETGLYRYLEHAINIADFLTGHPGMPDDMIPYWDYDAPGIPDAKRDASAGAIMASALTELGGYVDNDRKSRYLEVAGKQLRSLSSPAYRAGPGENGNFILKHSVGSLPAGSEVDVPLTYADYYYIEALLRYRKLLR